MSFHAITLRSTLIVLIVAILGFGIFYYVVFQARLLILGPQITLLEQYEIQQSDPTIDIRGSAHNIASLSLNGRDIFTDDRGFFQETLVLPAGYTIMTLKAKDRYGRETSITHPFVHIESTVN